MFLSDDGMPSSVIAQTNATPAQTATAVSRVLRPGIWARHQSYGLWGSNPGFVGIASTRQILVTPDDDKPR